MWPRKTSRPDADIRCSRMPALCAAMSPSLPEYSKQPAMFKSIHTHELGAQRMAKKTDPAPEAPPVELGLDTFGDVAVDADGRHGPVRAGHPQRGRGGRARRPGRRRLLRRRRAPPRRLRRSRRPRSCSRRSPAAPSASASGTAVTVLSSDDPVRVFERFATLDAVSQRPRRDHPRSRLVHRVVPAVRLRPRQDYEELFEEKLDLFAAAARRGARHLVRARSAPPLHRPAGLPEDRVRPR